MERASGGLIIHERRCLTTHGPDVIKEVKSYVSGAVAQLGARIDGIDEVTGSNPVGSTTKSLLSACP
jgi:hypothetical protein